MIKSTFFRQHNKNPDYLHQQNPHRLLSSLVSVEMVGNCSEKKAIYESQGQTVFLLI